MIHLHLYIEKKSPSFKALKRKGLLDKHFEYLMIYSEQKPCIGELIELTGNYFSNQKLNDYIYSCRIRMVFRIIDLKNGFMEMNNGGGITIIDLKVVQVTQEKW